MAKFKGKILKCKECGEKFKVSPSRVDKAKYCSTKCADKHRNDNNKKKKIKLVCKHCGKTFETFPSHKERRKYCSNKCKNIELSYNAPLDNHFYNRTFWRQLRKSVLERDEHKCKICGLEQERLHVHHIKPRHNGGKDKMSNLISLCNSCHKKVHVGIISLLTN